MVKTTIILHGGIGNQLFQFFFALKQVNSDLQLLRVIIPRHRRINNLDLLEILDKESIKKLEIISLDIIFYRIISKIRFIPKPILKCLKVVTDECKSLNSEKIKRPFLIYGYFQNLNLILKREKILKLLDTDLKQNFLESRGRETLGVHIRRGDYLNKNNIKKHGLIPISEIIEKFIFLFKNINDIYIYSDSDIREEFGRNLENFLGPKCVSKKKLFFSYDLDKTDKDVFADMGNNKFLICSNSTFSYWAGYLNNNVEYIYLPGRWFRNETINHHLIHPRVEIY